jgi:hypothetical protein
MKTADRREARRKPNHEKFNLNFKTVWRITVGMALNTDLAASEDFDEILSCVFPVLPL